MTKQAPTDTATTTGLYYGGADHDAGETFDVPDPSRSGALAGRAAAATREQALDAVAAARDAFPAWSARPAAERAALLREAAAAVLASVEEDAAVLSAENGKIVQECAIDLYVFAHRVGLACDLAAHVDEATVLEGPPVESTVRYQPLGVVSIIVPFNWPAAILGASLPYALVAGNTTVVKPPPSAPLATARMVRRFAEKLPPGVVNVVTGRDADIGEALVDNPDVDKVCFTGSVGGGRRIMGMAARNLTRVTLELGGNDPAVFLPDAPMDDDSLDNIFHGVFDTTGQICMNAKRIYVHRARRDELVAGLTARLEKVVLGRGTDPGTTMGPLNSPDQARYVVDLIEEARAAGAEVREFGELPGGELASGNFVRPALVLDPDPALRIVTEEQFGPAIPIMAFDDVDEAVAAANDTWAGLCASVWTADPATAHAVGARLRAGYVFHNTHGAAHLDQRAPFGGVKSSGFGREMGLEGLREFMDTHTVGILQEQPRH
ncbi:MAG: aldehyde dehydrogenase family protein [Arthrobacter sp.]|uniref:aldehyde dehydrogenase family protein n=1 Tax=Arthrobacter sp. TaxID=1667 RepID=UPI00349A48DB